ncbi:hypothetical protein KHS38_12005 [Mucilaginibacter sp. Bleaf8]|uniref:hypothetical protein n=1 Tax=Mucilaginibacter sp. Bleaf8 TaxID=2834430 RepID=UPI001BD0036A|nr:hypothetical protein [Mucilaginibacter sp. Bleaf8]MBS7565128.1 hypothetical protein [Mucilaginibacter sp. Bleaf8]
MSEPIDPREKYGFSDDDIKAIFENSGIDPEKHTIQLKFKYPADQALPINYKKFIQAIIPIAKDLGFEKL